jgi:DNA-binding PadR family transcriptional regulator
MREIALHYIGCRYIDRRCRGGALSDAGKVGRFAEPSLLILVSLSDGPKHGYAIMTDVEERSGFPLRPGTLYAALARLERIGFIEPLQAEDRRRPYRLTEVGSESLREQLRDLSGFASAALRRLGDRAV